MKLTPQQSRIVEIHRDKQWHCSTEYEYIRDHRKRISELNNDGKNGKPVGYMYAKGWILRGIKCDGSPKGCKGNHDSELYMRRAERLDASEGQITRNTGSLEVILKAMEIYFEALPNKI